MTATDSLQPKMRKIATWVGVFFLAAMAGSLVGGVAFVEPYLAAENPLTALAENRGLVVIGILLELVNGMAVAGIGILMYPVFRRQSRLSAAGYLALRILEAVFCCLIVVTPLALLLIGRFNLPADAVQAAAALAIAQREAIATLLIPIFFGTAAIVFYISLHKARLLPSWLTIWGLVGAILILLMNLLQFVGLKLGDLAMVFALPIILNEITLGIWLIAKGFEPAFQGSLSGS